MLGKERLTDEVTGDGRVDGGTGRNTHGGVVSLRNVEDVMSVAVVETGVGSTQEGGGHKSCLHFVELRSVGLGSLLD